VWMIVFGAGASFDSVPEPRWSGRIHKDRRPPLTNQLFEQRPYHVQAWTMYEWCADLVNELWPIAQASAEDPSKPGVEEHLQELVATYGDRQRTQRQLMALRFYLKWVIHATFDAWVLENGPANNYATLLNWLDRIRDPNHRLVLVTFNYDPMLDEARERELEDSQDAMDDYIEGSSLLFRPHGYEGWSRLARIARGTSDETLIRTAGTYELTNDIVPAGSEGGLAEIPAIAIPTRGKVDFECPEVHRKAFEDALENVTHILTIGWRAREEAFLGLCRGRMRGDIRGMVVSGTPPGAETIADHLRTELGSTTIVASEVHGFSGLIAQGLSPMQELFS
jgi:hypothetical protein